MKYVNGLPVYEKDDPCALHEYSEEMAKKIQEKENTQKQQIENLNKQYTQLNQGLQAANIQIGVLDSLKADRAETEKQFRKIYTDQERQDKLINGLKDSAINITTDKQKSLHIEDSSNMPAKILPFGNSEQETRSGKNILNINSSEYEKYGASPSPEFPSPIKNVGSNINMLKTDASGWEQGGLNTDTGDIVSSTVRLRTKDYIAVKSNTDYYVSIQNKDYCFVNILMYSDSGEFLGNYSDKNFSINGTTSLRVNFGASCDKIKVLIKNVGGTTINVDEIPNIKPQLEESSVFTAYREYNCGNIAVSVFNKNWADGNRLAEEMKSFSSTAVEKIIDNRNCIRFSGATFRRELGFEGLKNNYKENTQYIIKFSARVENTDLTSGYALFMQAYNKNGEMIGSVRKDANGANWIDFTFTTNKNSTLSFIAFSFGTATYWYLDKDSIQIYEATDEGDCPVYEGQKIVFPLEEGQRLMLGDYLGEDEKIHHVRKQISLDETKDWKQSSVISSVFYLDLEENITQDTTKFSLICNQYVYGGILEDTVSNAKNNEIYGFISNSTLLKRIVLRNDNFTDLQSFKNSLSEQKGIPLILEFNLAEEETEDFTEEQKTVFEQLQNCDMYKPVTNITTEENMALIEANYIADTKTYIDNKYNNLAQQVINQIKGGN